MDCRLCPRNGSVLLTETTYITNLDLDRIEMGLIIRLINQPKSTTATEKVGDNNSKDGLFLL